MEYMSLKEAAARWNMPGKRVASLCEEGRIAYAVWDAGDWRIPATANCPGAAEPVSGRARPFMKWAGGKGQLLEQIGRYYPFAGGRFVKYAEPFVGGGAVLFDILNRFELKEVYIGDTNAELIHAYRTIRNEAEPLIASLSTMQKAFLPLDAEGRKAYYLAARERFNELKVGELAGVETAALLIFLNKTCFNGLYRVNRKGLFNVPMGAYKAPAICDAENIRAVSRALRNVTIVCCDYRESESFIDKDTFVYFDPPYRPLNQTANFTSYTEAPFDDKAQKELADFAHRMSRRGAGVLVSNSDPKNVDESDTFFDDIYASFRIERVRATRMISCRGESRGKISELLISHI